MISLGIAQLGSRIEQGEISPVEAVEYYLDRIVNINARLDAFVTVADESARRAAKIAEDEIKAGKYRGPLHGVPIGVKDIVDTSGIRTTYGSAIFRNNVPERDATVVSRLKQAGAIILGKTNTAEFALGFATNNLHYGITRNPWKTDRIPGGSSGGSAAAVAASLCVSGLGTDTGGSIRNPSAFCGVVGLKPTYGRVSTAGVFPLAIGMDHVGTIASSVADSAIMLQTLAGFDEADPRSLMVPVPDFSRGIGNSIDGFKVVVSSDLIPEVIDPQVETAYKDALAKIEHLGGELVEKRFKTPNQIINTGTVILNAEAATQHSELLRDHGDEYGANVIGRFRAAQKITASEYIGALRDRDVIRREIELFFQDADFLVTPTVQILAPRIGEEEVTIGSKRMDIRSCCVRFNMLGNITGIPAIALPYGYSAEGLPLSVQLMAPRLCEANLLKLAYALEKATPGLRNRHPPL